MKLIETAVMFCMLGVVDQIQGNVVIAEVQNKQVDLPLWIFPCEISEGDIFYFTKIDGVLELRCGEPPE